MSECNIVESIKEFEGTLHVVKHRSSTCNCIMQFSLYLPPQSQIAPVPAIYWLSGLTCTDENFRVKAGAQRYAAEHGVALVIPDTSPRGSEVPDDENYDFGQGAGFYLNSTVAPFSKNYHMYDYIVYELPKVIHSLMLPINDNKSISGHSMGGHGALMIGMKNPKAYKSISAFSPICNPAKSAWGINAFTGYIGTDQSNWRQYDACCLIEDGARPEKILIDQGTADEFYPQELLTENLQAVASTHGVEVEVRMQTGYDHGYHFIATFIGDHIAWHAKRLK